MPPGGGGNGGGGTAQLTRQLVDQMRQVQDTVAVLAKDDATLKAKVAVLEASVGRLQGGGTSWQKQVAAPEHTRHRSPPEASGTATAAPAAPPHGRSPTPSGRPACERQRTLRGQQGRGSGGSGATQTPLRGAATAGHGRPRPAPRQRQHQRRTPHVAVPPTVVWCCHCATPPTRRQTFVGPSPGGNVPCPQAFAQQQRQQPRQHRQGHQQRHPSTIVALSHRRAAAATPAADPPPCGGRTTVPPLPFAEALALARSLGLASEKEWRVWCKEGTRPPDVPCRPDRTHKDGRWEGGTGSAPATSCTKQSSSCRLARRWPWRGPSGWPARWSGKRGARKACGLPTCPLLQTPPARAAGGGGGATGGAPAPARTATCCSCRLWRPWSWHVRWGWPAKKERLAWCKRGPRPTNVPACPRRVHVDHLEWTTGGRARGTGPAQPRAAAASLPQPARQSAAAAPRHTRTHSRAHAPPSTNNTRAQGEGGGLMSKGLKHSITYQT